MPDARSPDEETETVPPLPPLPDGGLAQAMPDWLRDPPAVPAMSATAPAGANDPAAFLTEDDLPAWLRQLSGQGPAPALPATPAPATSAPPGREQTAISQPPAPNPPLPGARPAARAPGTAASPARAHGSEPGPADRAQARVGGPALPVAGAATDAQPLAGSPPTRLRAAASSPLATRGADRANAVGSPHSPGAPPADAGPHARATGSSRRRQLLIGAGVLAMLIVLYLAATGIIRW